jgi:hypothetical protein
MPLSDGFWLFIRGSQSVRLSRHYTARGGVRLTIFGPGPDVVTYEFADITTCIPVQMDVERRLVAEGFHFLQVGSDRRCAEGPWQGLEQRRRSA